MIVELLSREHRNIERLLAVLEHELEIFDCGGRPDYEVVRAIIGYFDVYSEMYHHACSARSMWALRLARNSPRSSDGSPGSEFAESIIAASRSVNFSSASFSSVRFCFKSDKAGLLPSSFAHAHRQA